MTASSLKSGEMHWESKHPKLPFEPERWTDLHELNGGVTTQGIAVKGAAHKKTVHELSKTKVGQAELERIAQEKEAVKL